MNTDGDFPVLLGGIFFAGFFVGRTCFCRACFCGLRVRMSILKRMLFVFGIGRMNDLDILRSDVCRAFDAGEFSLVYQCVVSLSNVGKIEGFEVLLRWNHPTLGYIPPSKFIPLLEETRSINRVGLWVLREAMIQVKRWQDFYRKDFFLAVNLSVEQVHEGFLNDIRDAFIEANFPPQLLILEITEGKPLSDRVGVEKILNALCCQGISIAIDDFGTGFSSLGRLHTLPIAYLKIDQSFLREDRLWEVVRWIYGFSENFAIITEGVETAEHLEKLLKINGKKIDGYAQGYYFSRPIGADAMTTHLSNAS